MEELENKSIILEFQGYTWDEYFYVIANKSGILIAYKGGLDKEGTIRLDEIVFVGESDQIVKLYESHDFDMIRCKISDGEKLFFSLAEMQDTNRKEIVKILKEILIPNDVTKEHMKYKVNCKGACALFPKDIIETT